jgi:hypothetical protein
MIDRRNAAIAAGAGALALAVAVGSVEAQQQAAARVATPVLERYVGEYVYPDGNTIRIVLSEGTLFREAPGQRVALSPISETLFHMGPVFTVEFVIDDAGGVTPVLSGRTSLRRTRPVNASTEPSPRTSSPARSRLGPASSSLANTCCTGSKRRSSVPPAAGTRASALISRPRASTTSRAASRSPARSRSTFAFLRTVIL